MADTLKLLYTTSANRCPSGTSLVALYTAPTPAMVARILVANRTASPATFRIALLPNTVLVGGVLNEHYIAYDVTCPANDTVDVPVGGGIETGVTVAVQTGTGSALVFNVFGMEVS